MILKGYPRISETFISNEILLLESLGFKIHIFSMRQPREPFCHDILNSLKASVDYLPETILKPLPLFLYHNLQLAAKKPRLYLSAVRTAFRRFCRTKKSATIKHLLQAGLLVNRFLKKSGAVHLHAHFAHSPTSVAMFASYLSGVPFSFTAHAKDIYTSDSRQLREKIGLAKFVATCTEYNKKHLKSISRGNAAAVATPIYRIYHGIDMGLFSWDPVRSVEKAKPNPPFQIMTVARITPKKGLNTVYRALKILKDKGVKFEHILIGDGEEREKILSLVSTLGLRGESRWLGTRPHDVVLEHYRTADLFVLGCEVAKNGDRDGIPNVLVESMAMGVPSVATRISAIPELIRSGRTGLLVKPKDPEALAEAMLLLLENQDLRRRIIPAARRFAEDRFDNKKPIRRLASAFETHAGL
jgi:glycosyltransferase involved in cell wall biosynthesis